MIKFRAWVKPGVLSNHLDGVIAEAKPDFIERVCLVKRDDLIGNECFDEIFDFDDLILMKSTGLKDKNGVEIYVGDIVILTSKSINYADTYWNNYAEVFQQPNGAYRLRGKGIYETELYGNRKKVTLTGNIYETPELLENDRFCTETDDPDC
ncbi:YopX family protein [Guyparkeria sp. 1SP6A2]|nr:YopX family protein [Guyparkeria sp. 1SP6A2]